MEMTTSSLPANVVSLQDRLKSQTMRGDAFCLQCGHHWVAVAPPGTVRLECPECHTEKGLFKFECVVPDGTAVWECGCGNQLFYLTPVGHLCANCGVYARYE